MVGFRVLGFRGLGALEDFEQSTLQGFLEGLHRFVSVGRVAVVQNA